MLVISLPPTKPRACVLTQAPAGWTTKARLCRASGKQVGDKPWASWQGTQQGPTEPGWGRNNWGSGLHPPRQGHPWPSLPEPWAWRAEQRVRKWSHRVLHVPLGASRLHQQLASPCPQASCSQPALSAPSLAFFRGLWVGASCPVRLLGPEQGQQSQAPSRTMSMQHSALCGCPTREMDKQCQHPKKA